MQDNPFSENLFDAAKFDLVRIEEKIKVLFGVASITDFLNVSDDGLKKMFSETRKAEEIRKKRKNKGKKNQRTIPIS